MSTPKTQPTQIPAAEFLAQLSDENRRADCIAVVELMRVATGEEPTMWGASIVGFGRYRYRYESGREGEWPVIGFSPRKNDLTLYITPGFDRHGELLGRLGKHKTGKSCLYVKKLADVDQVVLKTLIEAAVQAMDSQRIYLPVPA